MNPPEPARLGDVLWGAAGAAGILVEDRARAAAARLRLPSAHKTCVVLVDGLGAHNLAERAEHAPFLTAALAQQVGEHAPVTRLTAAVPTTTATNLAFFGTGEEGGRTGMLGYTVRNPVTGGLLNLISWRGGGAPQRWQHQPTVFEHMAGAGHTAIAVAPWRFDGSPLTMAALRGAEFIPAESLLARVDAALSALRRPEVSIVYLYWGEVDAVGHHQGWASSAWAEQLAEVDAGMQRLATRLPYGVSLIVTADHGMVDIGDHPLDSRGGRIDAGTHPELTPDVDLIGGEPRFSHVYTQLPEDVAHRWRSVLGDHATVLTRPEAIEAGWFGPVADSSISVIGDVVVAAMGQAAVLDSRSQSAEAMRLRGMHGSVTPQERDVPLVVIGP